MNPTTQSVWNGQETTLTWIRATDLSPFKPITQCHAVCFDERGDILIIRVPGRAWHLPGGTPEAGESSEETVARELLEEADVAVKEIRTLGVQQVDFPNNPNLNEGEHYFQARFICRVQEVKPQTPDPATGLTWERRFVPAAEVTEYIQWGELGAAIFREAIELNGWKNGVDMFTRKFLSCVQAQSAILDLGAGPGRHSALFVGAGHRVTAVDRQPAPEGLAGVKWIAEDIREWVERDDETQILDAVFCRNVIQFLDAEFVVEKLLPRLAEMLRPGGVIAIQTFYQAPEPPFAAPFAAYWRTADLLGCLAGWTVCHVAEHPAVTPDMRGQVRKFFLTEVIARKP